MKNLFESLLRVRRSLVPLALLVAPASGQGLDFSRPVFLGDSLTAGYQNRSLNEGFQPNGYAKLIARQAGASLPLPLIGAPGIPNALVLVDPGPPPVIEEAPGQSIGRVDPTIQTTNLAVPGHTVHDALLTRPDLAFDDLTDLVLGLPGLTVGISRSQIEWAEALAPSVAIVWLGANDVLGAAILADSAFVTPPAFFAADYVEALDRLQATGAQLVIANVPDVATIPYLVSFDELVSQLQLPPNVVSNLMGLARDDFVIPDAFPFVTRILLGQMQGPLPKHVVFAGKEVSEVREVIAEYNWLIAAEAAARGAVHVDVHGLLGRMDAFGVTIGAKTLTTGFLGGLFSLDGVHPTNTGYAILANGFIHAMNTQAGAGIPYVDLAAVMQDDPLVLPGSAPGPGAKELAGPASDLLRDSLLQ